MNENKEELVSIIMPAYNSEKYIIDAIKSVYDQTYLNWELIIIDDASKDSTIEIIEKLIRDETRVELLRSQVNGGVSNARNRGLNRSRGNWIIFLDSDDIWEKTKLEKQMELVNETNGEFIFTASSFINEEGKAYTGTFQAPEKVTYKDLLFRNVISCSSVLVHRKHFFEIKMEDDKIHEDYTVWLKILKKGMLYMN